MNFSQLASKSRFYQRLARRYESYLHLLEPGDPQRESMQETLKNLLELGLDTPSALRILRQLVMHRLIKFCLLYTSDAADDLLCVDPGGRRILQKKKKTKSQFN